MTTQIDPMTSPASPKPSEQYVSHFTDLMKTVRDEGLLERKHVYYWMQIGVHVAAFFAIWVGFFLLGNSWFQLI
ncbi:MAG: acyl-CoA desaturase, partial [Aeromicrobium sp.]